MIGFLLKLLRRLLLALIVLGLGALGIGYYLAQRSLPDYAENRSIGGIGGPIEIIRDARATPHVFAQNDRDVFFGLGYAHAQDRLWQMELRRRIVQGRLTETFGGWVRLAGALTKSSAETQAEVEGLIKLDAAIRTLDLAGRAERSLESFQPETRAALDAYAAGVNAWLARVDEAAMGGGAPELLALGLAVEPWRPADSAAVLKLVGASLSSRFQDELTRGALAIALDPERLEDLFADDATTGGQAASREAPKGGPAEAAMTRWARALGAPFGGLQGEGASNAWAVAGPRSASRAPLLANDPHLELTVPSIWYVARLEFPDGGVIGATIPGAPAVIIGRNARIAWGATAFRADVADVYLEALDPSDDNRYRTATGWATFETREVLVPLGDGEAVATTARATERGPVLPLDWPPAARVTPPGHVLSLSWTLLDEADTSLEAAMTLMRARSVEEALAASRKLVAPPLNLMIADASNIAMVSAGKLPLRREDSETRGALPSRGWRPENAWVGDLPEAARPLVVNPESGLLANANNQVGARAFPEDLAQHWPPGFRQQRILNLLAAREFHTSASFQAMQSDTVSEMARELLPLVGRALFEGIAQEQGMRREALRLLAAWNGDMDAVAVEPLIFTAWMRALTRGLSADELGPRAALVSPVRPRFIARVFRDEAGAGARWCDVVDTPAVETCAEVASAALDEALAELKGRYGERLAHWRWGLAHAARHRHEPFGRVPGLAALFDLRHEMAGGDHTLWRAQSSGAGPEPDETVHAGGFRAVYDIADLDRSVYAISTGQSGHFLSRHYDDFLAPWQSGEYLPLSLARRDIEAGSVGVTRLEPLGGAGGAEAGGAESGTEASR